MSTLLTAVFSYDEIMGSTLCGQAGKGKKRKADEEEGYEISALDSAKLADFIGKFAILYISIYLF